MKYTIGSSNSFKGFGNNNFAAFTPPTSGRVYGVVTTENTPTATMFKKAGGFNSKCFYKSFLNTYYERRILKPANPDDLFTHPGQLAKYNKSKEALIRIKFLQS